MGVGSGLVDMPHPGRGRAELRGGEGAFDGKGSSEGLPHAVRVNKDTMGNCAKLIRSAS